MTDRELLELAAKAAEVTCEWETLCDRNGGSYESMWIQSEYWKWNPLADDGNALRLAVKLRLEVDIHHTGIAVRTPNGIKVLVNPEDEPDANAATRRAIVRAAAEIGRNMK